MIHPGLFYDKLREGGIEYFVGVPDSLLKDFCNYVFDSVPSSHHKISANEGNAIAIAAGVHIASGTIPLVYLQNAGLGNTVNPLLSMADSKLYAIPMIILVGWRGQNGINDAEQHLPQGMVTLALLDAMHYSYEVLSHNQEIAFSQLDKALHYIQQDPQPYFLVVEKNTFEKYHRVSPVPHVGDMSREEALHVVAKFIPEDSFVVTTTGKTSREWFEVREQLHQSHRRDFLTVGSMGHTSSIALGMALASKKRVVCIDGDGSMLMHLGALVVAGQEKLDNFQYIIVNNYSHESVGGLPTPLDHVNFKQLFHAIGFSQYYHASDVSQLRGVITDFFQSTNGVLEITVKQGSREDLARPDIPARELARMIKAEFMSEASARSQESVRGNTDNP